MYITCVNTIVDSFGIKFGSERTQAGAHDSCLCFTIVLFFITKDRAIPLWNHMVNKCYSLLVVFRFKEILGKVVQNGFISRIYGLVFRIAVLKRVAAELNAPSPTHDLPTNHTHMAAEGGLMRLKKSDQLHLALWYYYAERKRLNCCRLSCAKNCGAELCM